MKFRFKAFTSLLLTIVFLILAFSGVILFITPRGRTANWTGWSILKLSKQQWQSMHYNIALLFLIIALLHLFLNWGVFWSYIKKICNLGWNMKAEILLATALAAIILVGTIYRVPPFGTLQTYNNEIKDYWDNQAGEEPGGPGRGPGAGMGGQGRGPGFGRGRGQGGGFGADGFGQGRSQGPGRQGKGQGRGSGIPDD
jgi:hypothetical protein